MSGVTWAHGEVVGLDHAYTTTSADESKIKDQDSNPVETLYRGEVKVMMQSAPAGTGTGTAGTPVVAYPCNMNATRIPLIGEHVMLFQGPGNQLGPQGPDTKTGTEQTGRAFDLEWYYLDALSLQGSVHLNANPGANVGGITGQTPSVATTSADGETVSKADSYESSTENPTTNTTAATPTGAPPSQNTLTTLPGNEFKEQVGVNNLQPFEGDLLLQGRFGQSLRFGSSTTLNEKSKSDKRYQKSPTWAPGNAGEGAPIIILRAGPDFMERSKENDYIIEQVTGDKSSMYICADQQIPIYLASNIFDALNQQGNMGDSKQDESGTAINATHCNASGAPTAAPTPYGPDNPIPSSVEELPEVPGEWPMYNTSTGKPSAMGKLRIIGGWPFFEHLCEPVLNLIRAAKEDGHSIKLNSGYRGIKNVVVDGKKYATGQLTLRRQNAKNGAWKTDAMWNDEKSKLWKARSGNFKPATAAPGFSKHQNGIAVDMNTSSKSSKTGIYNWLCLNAYKYGFIRTVSSEEWHFEYRPGSKTFDKVAASSSKKWHGHHVGHPHA